MIQGCELTMKPRRDQIAGLSGFLRGVEIPNAHPLAVDSNPCSELPVRAQVDANEPACVRLALPSVHVVLVGSADSQILPPVVQGVAVHMIDMAPFAFRPKDQAMEINALARPRGPLGVSHYTPGRLAQIPCETRHRRYVGGRKKRHSAIRENQPRILTFNLKPAGPLDDHIYLHINKNRHRPGAGKGGIA